MNQQQKNFALHVRNGWKWNPEVLESLQSGEETPESQAAAYCDADEANALSVKEAAEVIRYCLKSTEY